MGAPEGILHYTVQCTVEWRLPTLAADVLFYQILPRAFPHSHVPPAPRAALAAAACALVLCVLRRRRRGAAPDPEAPAKPGSEVESKGLDSMDTGAGSFMQQHMLKQKTSAAARGAPDSAAGSPASSCRIGVAAKPGSSSMVDISRTDELLSWVSAALHGPAAL